MESETPVGGYGLVPQEVVDDLWKIAAKLEGHVRLTNGKTALLWHLIATMNQHSEKKA